LYFIFKIKKTTFHKKQYNNLQDAESQNTPKTGTAVASLDEAARQHLYC